MSAIRRALRIFFRMPDRWVMGGFFVAGMFASSIAFAQDAGWKTHPAFQDRWMLQLGAYRPNVDTTASLNSTGGVVNGDVSFESDLKLKDRETLPTFLASVRLGERWKMEFEYFSLNRSASNPVSRTISWGDNTYTLGTVVTSEFNSDIYRLSAGYSFVKDDKKEAGVVLGLHATDFEASIRTPGLGKVAGDALAPLPTIGFYVAYAFTPKWLVSGRFDYFSLDYDDYDGSLANFNIGVDYRFTRHFGAGLGYRHVEYDVTLTKSSFTGNVNYKFSGPMLYGVASF